MIRFRFWLLRYTCNGLNCDQSKFGSYHASLNKGSFFLFRLRNTWHTARSSEFRRDSPKRKRSARWAWGQSVCIIHHCNHQTVFVHSLPLAEEGNKKIITSEWRKHWSAGWEGSVTKPTSTRFSLRFQFLIAVVWICSLPYTRDERNCTPWLRCPVGW